MITNLPYLKASFNDIAPYLPYTYNKYHLQGIEVDQSQYVTNYEQCLYKSSTITIPTYLPVSHMGNNSSYRPHRAGSNNITTHIRRAVIII